MDDICQDLSVTDLLTFIGLCIAAFAFLSSYLAFPKNLITKLKENLYNGDEENKEKKEKKEKVIFYFYSVDLFAAWTLILLILSIIASIGFLLSKLKLAWYQKPYVGLRIFLASITIFYACIIIHILQELPDIREQKWLNNRRFPVRLISNTFLLSSFSMLYISCYLDNFAGWFLVSLLFSIASLFTFLVWSLAVYNPLTELGKYLDIID